MHTDAHLKLLVYFVFRAARNCALFTQIEQTEMTQTGPFWSVNKQKKNPKHFIAETHMSQQLGM